MKSGSKPVTRYPKRNFHDYFGGIVAIADFNVDKRIWNPDQEEDGAPTECTGYGVADIGIDMDGVLYTPDRQYAAAQFMEGVVPNTGGADPLLAMEAAVALGFELQSKAQYTAKQYGELMCANFANWPTYGIAPKIRVYNALGYSDPFTSVLSAIYQNQFPVGIGSQWFPEWLSPNSILQAPNFNQPSAPWHFYTAKGQKTIGAEQYMIIKPWIGPTWGDSGFGYMSREIFNQLMTQAGTTALTFGTSGSRWLSVAGIAVQHPKTITTLLPVLSGLV